MSLQSPKAISVVADSWPAAIVGFGGFLTVVWVIALIWLVLSMLLQLF